ncbi:recombinase family protein [Mucilaginibacter gossypiicola]|uniref:recombinase family protein n=1 Tax=Mucilaginibacter gossypiicola TaxID=551995 RepID=UPI000B87A056|nr:recombinase family protein [Mucilaginibacter gossypiicola]
MKTAILYIRVSTDEQADKGFSQRDQDERLRQYCERNNIIVGQVIFEDHSAKTFDRPAWNKMLSNLKQTKGKAHDKLIFTKWDRFSRNTADAYGMISVLMKLGLQPVAIEQPLDLSIPESKIMLAVYLSMPEVENDRRALNVKYGMRRGKKEGRWMGRALPGYINKTRENGTKYIAFNEPESAHMKWAFEQIAENIFAIENIWAMARRRGLKCSRNSFWEAIRNPCYCGKVIVPAFNDEPMTIVQGVHEALISETLYHEVQDVLTGRKRDLAIKAVCPKNLPLRGFLLCPECSRTLTGSASKGRTGYYYYYHCKAPCKVRLKAEEVNTSLEHELMKFVPKPGVAELYTAIVRGEYGDTQAIYITERKKIIEQITEQNHRMTRLREMLLSDTIDSADYKLMKTECETKTSSLEADLADLSSFYEADIDIENLIENAVNKLKDLIYLYRSADIKGKQFIIGSIFSKKWRFSEMKGRTAEVNEAAALIYHINNTLQQKKTGVKTNYRDYSGKVPRAGVEPARFPTGV